MSLEYAPNRYHDFKQLNGVVLAQGNHLEPNSNLLPLAVEVDVWEGSTINSLVEVTLEAKSSQEEIVIPVSGVVEEYGSYYVFVQVTPELFEKREVIVGQNNGMEVVVKSGISTLERIVTNGAIKVKLAAVSNSVDPHAGHVH